MSVTRISYDHLQGRQKQLLDSAIEATSNSYAPYSRFYVGAALLTAKKDIITGVNVENASYGLTVCAERVAIFNAVSQDFKSFEAIAVSIKNDHGFLGEVGYPCGACRQVLREFSSLQYDKHLEIILGPSKTGDVIITDIAFLLPNSFGLENLGMDLSRYHEKP